MRRLAKRRVHPIAAIGFGTRPACAPARVLRPRRPSTPAMMRPSTGEDRCLHAHRCYFDFSAPGTRRWGLAGAYSSLHISAGGVLYAYGGGLKRPWPTPRWRTWHNLHPPWGGHGLRVLPSGSILWPNAHLGDLDGAGPGSLYYSTPFPILLFKGLLFMGGGGPPMHAHKTPGDWEAMAKRMRWTGVAVLHTRGAVDLRHPALQRIRRGMADVPVNAC